jgi:hypothetical protein
MRSRRAPVEQTAPSEFRPPFCPRPECADHRLTPPARYRYVRNGYYRRKCDRRRIQRYRCKRCGGGFSQQTFSVTYCMKRPDLLPVVANWLASGASLRRIARCHGGQHPERACHPSSIPRIARRIGSQCLLVLEDCHRQLAAVDEPMVFDHFESFVGMQENALAVATPVGKKSWYVYGLEPAWHRQATAGSRRCPRVGSSPGEIARSVRRMLDALLEKLPANARLELISDDHGEYPRTIARHPERGRIRLSTYANPRERRRGRPREAAARARDAALFPTDLLHMLQRNWLAEHRRETIAFGRRGEALLERLAIHAVGRNLVQRISERRNDPTTPAMRLELTERPWLWREVLGERRFPTRIRLRESAGIVFRREMRDPRGIVWPEHVRRRTL